MRAVETTPTASLVWRKADKVKTLGTICGHTRASPWWRGTSLLRPCLRKTRLGASRLGERHAEISRRKDADTQTILLRHHRLAIEPRNTPGGVRTVW